MIHLLQADEAIIATEATTAPAEEAATQPDVVAQQAEQAKELAENIVSGNIQVDALIQKLIDWAMDAGHHILMALIVYIIGHYVIKFINYLLAKTLERRKVEASVQTFLRSFVNIVLKIHGVHTEVFPDCCKPFIYCPIFPFNGITIRHQLFRIAVPLV